jgi:anti-sigma B factor antagonist
MSTPSTAGGNDPQPAVVPEPTLAISSTHEGSDALVVTVAGEVDIATSTQLRDEVLGLLATRPRVLVLCLEQVTFLDSTGLSALVAIHRRAHEYAVQVRLTSPARGPGKALHITGLDEAFAIYPTVASALAG